MVSPDNRAGLDAVSSNEDEDKRLPPVMEGAGWKLSPRPSAPVAGGSVIQAAPADRDSSTLGYIAGTELSGRTSDPGP
ncbi:hypothetical protein AAFF_G00434340 [Aldrovandia affinis]|uniref:Uncharacterized protein n=1 Tax=Aldrovandia affinis TaxID=143900 RepID=A0AAD7S857_9TELE|nr:hypothetical protein AAFF_G00434340 [Aldrovandia affinis]